MNTNAKLVKLHNLPNTLSLCDVAKIKITSERLIYFASTVNKHRTEVG